MRTAFVILATDESALLSTALAAAQANGFHAGLVVDNASTDDPAAVAASAGVPVLTLERRLPYTLAMNAGLTALISGAEPPDAVALLQADTFAEPGYLAAALAELGRAPDVGSVAPKLVRTAGPEPADGLGQIDAAAMSFDRRRKNSLVGHGAEAAAFGEPAWVFGADGAAALWRTAALIDCAVEGSVFDPNMPGWGCDADLAWRAQLYGWRARYAPDAVVRHIRTYSPSTRAQSRPEDRRTQFRNRLLMIAKNDLPRDLLRDAPSLLFYEACALGYALLVERELLGGYREALARLSEARRQAVLIRQKRRVRRAPFGLLPPAGH